MITYERIGVNRWRANCPFAENPLVKQAGFRWDVQERYWAGDDAAQERLQAILSPLRLASGAEVDPYVARFPQWVGRVPSEPGARVWFARTRYEERDIARNAGFRWDQQRKFWYTTNPKQVECFLDAMAGLSGRATAETRDRLERQRQAGPAPITADAEVVAASMASDTDVIVPAPPGLVYRPFQRAGIVYARRFPSVMFADDMGLGKTIQAIGMMNEDDSLKRVLIMCPATPKRNWYRELHKWSIKPRRIAIAEGSACPVGWADVLIINYDIIDRHKDALHSVEWDFLVCDEAQALKNANAKRTKVVLGEWDTKTKKWVSPPIKARRRAFLTGTPTDNSIADCYTLIRAMGIKVDGRPVSKRVFKDRFGTKDTGFKNLDQLQLLLRGNGMVRRLKQDVLKDLPPKERQVIEMTITGKVKAALDAADQRYQNGVEELAVAKELAKVDDTFVARVKELRARVLVDFTEMSRVRHECAVMMAPGVIAQIIEQLEQTGKTILFGHHRDVIELWESQLTAENIPYVKITGSTRPADRQAAVDRFQSDPDCKVFIGNIRAAGTAITLHAASYVAFGELDWSPGAMRQAEDRAHRIGQVNSVLIHYFVAEDTIQARMCRRLAEKQMENYRALDAHVDQKQPEEWVPPDLEPEEQQADEEQHAATARRTKEDIAAAAEALTPEDIADIHAKLRFLAGQDGDRARELNGWGFNRVDTQIGHALARAERLTPRQAALGASIVRKYHRWGG